MNCFATSTTHQGLLVAVRDSFGGLLDLMIHQLDRFVGYCTAQCMVSTIALKRLARYTLYTLIAPLFVDFF
jgi:hypothetical protein